MNRVSSFNEWDPLEEVIVGRLEHAMLPSWLTITRATIPMDSAFLARLEARASKATSYGQERIEKAEVELAGFIKLLESAGVTVRRPAVADHGRPYRSPDWEVVSGICTANPRDVFLVIGDEIIEAPMAHRDRYYEMLPYRPLLNEYFHAGARWTSAPKPQLSDALYDSTYQLPAPGEPMRYVTTEAEPVFDAADFVRCGRDIFVQRSHVTNLSGIEWLRRHLGDEYRIHEIHSTCRQAIHIDTTFMPLAPGKLLVNPNFLDVNTLPEIVRKWDILLAPPPVVPDHQANLPVSVWMNLNVLMLDEKHVVVEASQEPTMRALEKMGLEPVPCPFTHYYPFGGSFHCATLDVRRRGTLQSYF